MGFRPLCVDAVRLASVFTDVNVDVMNFFITSVSADEPQLLEDLNWIFTKLQASPKSQRRSNNDNSDVSSSDDKIRMQSIVDALFPWCKSCDEHVHKKKSIKKTMNFKGVFSSKKRKSLKKNASCDIEVPIQASSPRQPELIRLLSIYFTFGANLPWVPNSL